MAAIFNSTLLNYRRVLGTPLLSQTKNLLRLGTFQNLDEFGWFKPEHLQFTKSIDI